MKAVYRTHVFPYKQVPQGTDIILWGAGRIGRQYYLQVSASKYCNINAVIDTNADNIYSFPVKVSAPELLRYNMSFDFVIIAVADRCAGNSIMTKLLSWGVPTEKIIPYQPGHCYVEGIGIPKLDLNYNFLAKVRDCLRIWQAQGQTLVRVGNEHDGGYIMLDDFRPNGIAYSFGISGDVTWDDAIANKGIEVYMYDHTIEALPKQRNEFHFFKQGIASDSITDDLNTLENFIIRNEHCEKKHMILKMDVEGAEWGFLNMVSEKTLKKFDQIVFEIHCLLDNKIENEILADLKKINKTHAVVHVHANNYAIWFNLGQSEVTDALEVTWVNRDTYNLSPLDVNLPLAIDAPCNPDLPDVKLGHWNTV